MSAWVERTVRMPDPATVTPGEMVAFLRSLFGDGPVLLLRRHTEERVLLGVTDDLERWARNLSEAHCHLEAATLRDAALRLDPRIRGEGDT